MKNLSLVILTILLASSLVFQGCKKEDVQPEPSGSILPAKFKVNIPNSISHESSSSKSSGSNKTGGGSVDTLQGDEIYEHLCTFIHVGEGAGDIVEGIMTAIAVYGINRPMSLSYKSDEDGRTKNLVVVEKVTFDGVTWEFQLTIIDAASAGNDDGGKAIQVFWNRSPIRGIAILKPFNINRDEHRDLPDAMFRIDYSEERNMGYDAHMIVSIAGLPVTNPMVDIYAMSTLRMFVGRIGDKVDVYGNSNHPNARFFTNKTGFNWAFVASGDDKKDLGCAEVGLPPSHLNSSKRQTLLEDNSMKQVLSDEIYAAWPSIDSTDVDAFLANTDAPGYFDKDGFVSAGVSPGSQFDLIDVRLKDLTPYNPKDITGLTVAFK